MYEHPGCVVNVNGFHSFSCVMGAVWVWVFPLFALGIGHDIIDVLISLKSKTLKPFGICSPNSKKDQVSDRPWGKASPCPCIALVNGSYLSFFFLFEFDSLKQKNKIKELFPFLFKVKIVGLKSLVAQKFATIIQGK